MILGYGKWFIDVKFLDCFEWKFLFDIEEFSVFISY